VSKERLEQALKNWQAKLADCEHELSIVTDTSRKFELKKNIEECKENIDRIKNSLKSDFTELTPTTPKSQSPQAEYIEFDLDAGAWIDKNDSDTRVLRGGSWGIDPRSCRSATRFFNPPDNRFNFIGFRVLCEIPKTL
jgi:hypothetical protein